MSWQSNLKLWKRFFDNAFNFFHLSNEVSKISCETNHSIEIKLTDRQLDHSNERIVNRLRNSGTS